MVRRTVGARLRRLLRHQPEPAAVCGGPGARSQRDDVPESELHAADAHRRHDLLLEDRLEDGGQPRPRPAIWSFTTAGAPPPPPPPPPGATTLVLWASNTPSGNIHGNWTRITDATASGGAALSNPDPGAAKISPALANPANYFEQTFTVIPRHRVSPVGAAASRIELAQQRFGARAVQRLHRFGSVADWRIGSRAPPKSCCRHGSSDTSDSGWGWSDDGWDAPGTPIYFAADGPQTVRVQQREDGAIVDEIVLSPDTYLSSPPGRSRQRHHHPAGQRRIGIATAHLRRRRASRTWSSGRRMSRRRPSPATGRR